MGDLRAALREAIHALTEYTSGTRTDATIAELRSLVDAPRTVAELLQRCTATARVRWVRDGDQREACADYRGRLVVSILGADDRHAQFTDLEVEDLTRPAKLVEVGG